MKDIGDLEFDTSIPAQYRQGWKIARRNFGREISFYAPSLKRFATTEFRQSCNCTFLPVSVTGSNCALMCPHCQGQILAGMTAATTPERLQQVAADFNQRGARGMLISGGSDSAGAVPLQGFIDAIKAIKANYGFKILVHTGIADAQLAQGLAAAQVDAALIDIIGHNGTIREIYGLSETTTAAYERSLANLSEAGVPLAPHVVIGLHFGKIKGEMEALKMIAQYGVSILVLIGLLPLPGTALADCKPPAPAEMGEVFLAAREMLPTTPIVLGCERPPGQHKLATDALAVKAGLNGIAYPAEGIIGLAQKLGLSTRLSEMCCALLPQA